MLRQAAHEDVEQQLEALVRVDVREVAGQDREVRELRRRLRRACRAGGVPGPG
jgi:hypothetical protein